MITYIKEVEVKGLWGIHDLYWELTPSVNILSGGNGSGKSTILRCLSDLFRGGELSPKRDSLVSEISVTFNNGSRVSSQEKFDPTPYKVQSISTFDMSMRHSEATRRLSGDDILSELDWELHMLQTDYLNLQLEISKEIIAALSEGGDIGSIMSNRKLFFDILDSLFEPTGKSIDRESNTLQFKMSSGKPISPYRLSSGEKQILIILTSILVRNRKPGIMIMDEPEISLHFDWQRRMLEDILKLNPKMQLIVATHSPAVVMSGWVDCVSEITDLLTNTRLL